jgi:hypothetical protein
LRTIPAAEADTGTTGEDEDMGALALSLQWSHDDQSRFVARVGTIVGSHPSAKIVTDGGVKAIDHVFKLDISLEPGYAGAPVLDESGDVIGVVIEGRSGDGLRYAAKAAVIKPLLDAASHAQAENIAHAPPPDAQLSQGKLPGANHQFRPRPFEFLPPKRSQEPTGS